MKKKSKKDDSLVNAVLVSQCPKCGLKTYRPDGSKLVEQMLKNAESNEKDEDEGEDDEDEWD